MMHLSRMKAFFQTVDKQWRSPIIDAVLQPWEHLPGTAWVIWASSNFAVHFDTLQGPCVLRFVHTSERQARAIRAEIDFILHMTSLGVQAASPIPSKAGRWVETIETESGSYHAVAFAALEGEHYDDETFPKPLLPDWGRIMAEMHNAAQGYPNPGRSTWLGHLDNARAALPASEPIAREAASILEDQLGQIPSGQKQYGMIHYDLCEDNLFWLGDHFAAIDFDDCSEDWFAADIAYALRSLCGDRASQVNLQHPAFLDFLEGYRSVRGISPQELTRIPLFQLNCNLLKFSELLEIIEEGKEPDEVAWAAELREKLTRKVESYRTEIECFVKNRPIH